MKEPDRVYYPSTQRHPGGGRFTKHARAEAAKLDAPATDPCDDLVDRLARRATKDSEWQWIPERSSDPGTPTPWGEAQWERDYGDGIVNYLTSGHGGFHVSGAARDRMPPCLESIEDYNGWFEEDCAQAAVMLSFPEKFPESRVRAACEVMSKYYPDQLKALSEPPTNLDDDDVCACGTSLSDNEGYDGRCGSCADRAEAAGMYD